MKKFFTMLCVVLFQSLPVMAGAPGNDVLTTDYKTTRMVVDDYAFIVDLIKGAIGDRGIKINGVNLKNVTGTSPPLYGDKAKEKDAICDYFWDAG